jgi:hypothetical protein
MFETLKRFQRDGVLGCPYFSWIVLHPAGARKYLRELSLRYDDRIAGVIEDNRP